MFAFREWRVLTSRGDYLLNKYEASVAGVRCRLQGVSGLRRRVGRWGWGCVGHKAKGVTDGLRRRRCKRVEVGQGRMGRREAEGSREVMVC